MAKGAKTERSHPEKKDHNAASGWRMDKAKRNSSRPKQICTGTKDKEKHIKGGVWGRP